MSILKEITLGSKQHAELIAKSQQVTLGDLKRKVKHSTLPQATVDALNDLIKDATMPLDKVLTDHDFEQIAALIDADAQELKDLVGKK